ncbi:Endonuclease/Exonuclease/phosphatase family protein [Singulisphaera sp. GP187]|uniref:S1/P1 nuclease n=1 Tax=Singulisphaera sp. GP187 TaxID=1882752 RepID=UPI00092BDD1E|nr:S1/P1 nuclease [Singulisphaera sp. GP187]SIN78017.1 Endonuclease/Exonuclease/phosphatase family protein [Singulisphaera sp. GP187]
MRNRWSAAIMATLFLVAPSRPTLAWNKAGHMVTGAIAYRELKRTSPGALSRAIEILKKHPDFPAWKTRMDNLGLVGDDRDQFLFMQAARWPDDMQGPPGVTHRERHFINIPFRPGDTTVPAIPGGENILSGYKANREAFASASSDAEKAEALCWIFHLVGDIHQPLHSVKLVTAQFPEPVGDRGGTRFYIRAAAGGNTISLHQFWDGLILGSPNFQTVRNESILLTNRPGHAPADFPELAEKDFAHWASVESFALAKTATYLDGTLQGSTDGSNGKLLPADYAAKSKVVAERRCVLAGYRIADVVASLTSAGSRLETASAPTARLLVGFWNTENLFDTVDDPSVAGDEEFTPSGPKQWTNERLEIKLNNLARVISGMNNNAGPDILGLAEVENRAVVEALVAKLESTGRHFEIVHKDSPSDRGIDCALIYDAEVLKLTGATFHNVDLAPGKPTRDIVEAEFDRDGTPLFVFVNHWPSRGNDESQRLKAASTLRGRVDVILAGRADADFVIVGDLNDESGDKSVKTTLKALGSPTCLPTSALFDAMAPIGEDPDRGTIVFQNHWQVFDHLIVSPGLLDQAGFQLVAGSTSPAIVLDSQLFDPAGTSIPRPNRSYSGNEFHPTGFSDHLPISCILQK